MNCMEISPITPLTPLLNDMDTTAVKIIRPLDSCCHSYLTARGRCFTCPGIDYAKGGDDDDDDDGHDDDFEEE